MGPKDVDDTANCVDTDQTAAVLSVATRFAQTCLSKNLGSLRQMTAGATTLVFDLVMFIFDN